MEFDSTGAVQVVINDEKIAGELRAEWCVLITGVAKFADEGFAIARGLFSNEECDRYSNYFTSMVERGGDGWAETVVDPDHADPLRRYPRLLQPHRGDDVAMEYMLEPRISAHLTAFCGGEPYAVQTMVYFKPAGARGQPLHQDNMYLKVQPGTCVAAWLALDDCTQESGCMAVVPRSNSLPMLCQKETPGLDEICWGTTETPIPPGLTPDKGSSKKVLRAILVGAMNETTAKEEHVTTTH